jgi:hypothetical protein
MHKITIHVTAYKLIAQSLQSDALPNQNYIVLMHYLSIYQSVISCREHDEEHVGDHLFIIYGQKSNPCNSGIKP